MSPGGIYIPSTSLCGAAQMSYAIALDKNNNCEDRLTTIHGTITGRTTYIIYNNQH